MKCPNCKFEVKDRIKFCPKCGFEMPQIHYCSQCGAELKEEMKFCPKCGSVIGESNQGKSVINNYGTKLDEKSSSNNITIIHKKQSRTKKWLKRVAIIFGCYCVLSVIVDMCSDRENSDTSDSSVQEIKNNEYQREKLESLQSYNKAKSDLADISLSCSSILNQYINACGSWQMAYLTASQNNPSLFSQFENAYDNYTGCARKLIELCESQGELDEASIYKEQLNNAETQYNRMKGMY